MMLQKKLRHVTRGISQVAPLALIAALAPIATLAAPIEVEFQPPEVTREMVCVHDRPDTEVIAAWKAWDGAALPDLPADQLRRQLRVLRTHDPVGHFDTIETASRLLQASDPGYSETDHILDRIELLVDAGRFGTIAEEGLVARLGAGKLTSSPRAQFVVAELLLDGRAIERDVARGQELMISSAFASHTGALLHLAELTSDGTQVPGWDVAPELAVILAFGSLVGQVDGQICDRMNRIAGEYRRGDLVAENVALSERWFQLSADLGDHNAAWQVAQIQSEQQAVEKNPERLLTYLEQAAAAGLTYAKNELGRIYETGAIVPRDLDRARALYAETAAQDDRDGMIRLVQLLETLPVPTEADRAEQERYLQVLADSTEPPAWVLVKLGQMALDTQGRWAGEPAAEGYFRRALDIEHAHELASMRLAAIEMRYVTGYQQFREITSRLQEAAEVHGSSGPMADLQSAFMCRSPRAPQVELATYWREQEALSGNLTVGLEEEQLRAAVADPESEMLARIQAQALTGRTSSLALLLAMLEGSALDADPELLQALARGAQTGVGVQRARLRMRLDSEAGADPETLALLRQAVEDREIGAQEELLKLLLADGLDDAEREEAENLATDLAGQGNGRAMRILVDLAGGGEDATRSVFDSHAGIIEANGDFEALILALPYLEETARQQDYLGRARVAMVCAASHAVEMARATATLGRAVEARQWLDVALAGSQGHDWEQVLIADAMLEIADQPENPDQTDIRERAFELYEQGRAEGGRVATMRLMSHHRSGTLPEPLDEAELAELYVDLVEVANLDYLPNALGWLTEEGPEIQGRIGDRVDVVALYTEAAEAGDAQAQFDLASLLRRDPDGTPDLDRYAELLEQAASQGHDEAMLLLSEAYALGLGVEASVETSRGWLLKAAAAGNQSAARTARLLDGTEMN